MGIEILGEIRANGPKLISARQLIGPKRSDMKVDEKDLKLINERMVGWTVAKVESGSEDVFIIHMEKGKNKRTVVLGANDLGGWLSKRSR